jgi:hypothetical protein
VFTQSTALHANVKWINLAKIGLLVSLGLLIPALGLPQTVTGPLVNALLIIAVVTSGVGAGMLVGMVTPLNALLAGLLPLPLMVMIPFIALGNALFAGVFGALRARNYWLGVGVAALAKFGLLFAAVTWLVARPISIASAGGAKPVAISAAIVNMMQWPQLATALAGGVLAYAAVAIYNRLQKQS